MDGSQPKKFDSEKVRVELLPPDALTEIAKVLTFGAVKYAPGNWATGSGFQWSRLYGALLRHLFAWARGEDRDPESGLSHLAHAGCMLLFLLSHVLRRHGHDDRVEIGVQSGSEYHGDPDEAYYEKYVDEDAEEDLTGARAL